MRTLIMRILAAIALLLCACGTDSSTQACNPGKPIVIRDSDDLRTIRGCKEMMGLVTIEGTSLSDLTALKDLERIGILEIHDNPALKDLRGLEGLRFVEEFLSIDDNASLSSIQALSDSLGCGEPDCLSVRNNPLLSNCEADALAEQMQTSCFCSGNDDSECADSE